MFKEIINFMFMFTYILTATVKFSCEEIINIDKLMSQA